MTPESAPDSNRPEPSNLVTLTDLLVWVGERKRQILAFVLVVTLGSLAVAFLLPKTYVSRLTLLPPGNQGTSASTAALAALGSLGGLASLGAKAPDELYVALLRSDSVLRVLDEKFSLQARNDAETFDELKRKVGDTIRVSSEKKSGLITVEVEDREPAFAAELANAHFTELSALLSRLAVSEAQQRRVFFESQLQQSKDRLASAEDSLRQLQEQTGLIIPDKQSEGLFQAIAALRTQIAAKEIQIRVARSTLTADNPEFRRLQQELEGLRAELRNREAVGETPREALPSVAAAKLPESGLAYLRARRQLKIEEALLEGVLRQLEIARIDEAKEGQSLQLVDAARPPQQKSKPRRSIIVGGSFGVSLLLALIAACLLGYSRDRGRADARLRLRDAWTSGSRRRSA